MRLLLPGKKEGIPRFILETTKRLVANNPQHHFFFIFDRAYDPALIFSDNITPVVVGPQARHPWLWYWWFEHCLPRVFKKYKIDLFYSPEIYVSLKANVPTLMVSHDIVFETYTEHLPAHQQRYFVKNSPRFHKRADHIIAVSKFSKQDIIDQYKISGDKITVAGNACTDDFKPIDASHKAKIQEQYSGANPFVMYVGAIHPRKNVLRMIQAFTQYKKQSTSPLKLLVIGRMAWKSKEVEQAIHHTEDVIYLPNIHNELKEIMAASEALLFASLFEGFGIPILEGMKSGIPVITSNVNSMKEVAGEAAILVDPLSVEEISAGIKAAIENEELRSELVKAGFKRAGEFNWEDTASHVEQKLMELL